MPVSYEITEFTAFDSVASYSIVVMFTSAITKSQIPVTIDAFTAWNPAGEITQYDATFRWFSFLLDTLLNRAATAMGLSLTDAMPKLAGTLTDSVCKIHDQYCTGANQQYASRAECLNFLTTQIPFGKDYQLGRNSLQCRALHKQMVAFRPEVHCHHIGPTGGGMCVDDLMYEEKVTEKVFTNYNWAPRY